MSAYPTALLHVHLVEEAAPKCAEEFGIARISQQQLWSIQAKKGEPFNKGKE